MGPGTEMENIGKRRYSEKRTSCGVGNFLRFLKPNRHGLQSKQPLPVPETQDAFVKITPFYTCHFTIPASLAIEGLQGVLSPTSWRFFVSHEPTNTKLWFDLGVAHVSDLGENGLDARFSSL